MVDFSITAGDKAGIFFFVVAENAAFRGRFPSVFFAAIRQLFRAGCRAPAVPGLALGAGGVAVVVGIREDGFRGFQKGGCNKTAGRSRLR